MSSGEIAARAELDRSFVLRRLRAMLLDPAGANDWPTEGNPLSKATSAVLDDSQIAAATSQSQYTLVSAGPGTGKTRTLIARYDHLVRSGSPPDSIVILTFSRSAAGELARRCRVSSPTSHASPWIGTVHAYAYELLRRFSIEAGLRDRWRVISTDAAEKLMDRCVASQVGQGSRPPILPVTTLLRVVAQAKERGLDTTQLAQALAARTSDAKLAGKSAISECERFFPLYDETLARANRLDFADLVNNARRLLESRPVVARQVRAGCAHLLIDEYQDLTPAALAFIQVIVGEDQSSEEPESRKSLWAVGDRLQSIYQFQTGRSSCGMQSFPKQYPSSVLFQLSRNYRATKSLTDLVSDIAAKLTAAEPARQVRWDCPASAHEASPVESVTVVTASSSDAEYDGLASEITRLHNQGIPPQDQAVLCRTNAECATISHQLGMRGILVSSTVFWLQSPAVKRIMRLLEEAALGETVNRTSDTSRIRPNPSASPIVFLSAAVFELDDHLRSLWTLLPNDAGALQDSRALGSLLEEAARWESEVEPDPVHGKSETARLAAFARHMRRLRRDGHTLESKKQFGIGSHNDGVRVMTVHAAKGLEFDAVYLPNMADGSFPRRGGRRDEPINLLPLAGPETSLIDEESCLFFVAVSRAKQRLVLSYAQQAASGKTVKPSPFVKLLLSTETGLRAAQKQWHSARPEPPRSHPSGACDPTGELPSADDVHAYEVCPRQFWYRRLEDSGCERNHDRKDALTRLAPEPASVLNEQIKAQQSRDIAVAALSVTSVAERQEVRRPVARLAEALSSILSRRLSGSSRTQQIDPRQARLLQVATAIARGEYPAAPDSPTRCAECPYCYVCPD